MHFNGTTIIFLFVTLLSAYAAYTTFREKNIFALLFALVTLAAFGFFTVMTILNNGYPVH
jgi:hypothetical protein